MISVKEAIPKPLKRTLRHALDSWTEAVDILAGPKDELVPPARLNQSGLGGDFKEIGEEFLRYFRELGGLRPHEAVLDVGCGIGRMAVPLVRYLTADSKYEGFDIMSRQVRWCRRRISTQYPHFNFHVADIYNGSYNPRGRYQASEYTFPYGDGVFDFVFATSLFTHLLPKDMERYLSEIIRVMGKGGRCLITFFLINRESSNSMASKDSSLDFAYQLDGCYIANRGIPESAVAYQEQHIRDLYARCGLEIPAPIHYGSWCGRREFLSYQDIVVAHRA